jgi:hypothetical protein
VTFAETSLYTARSNGRPRPQLARKGKNLTVWGWGTALLSCPEALGSPTGYVVRPGQCLLWPHPSHSPSSDSLSSSSARPYDDEWVPNLSGVSVRGCHPQDPGGPIGCIRLLLPQPRWSSSPLQRLDIRNPRKLVHAWLCNEAVLGSLALRPARLLALHQQRLLLPSFRRSGHPETASIITT